jgi:DNA repair exonuclease SbcCD nuclease subunit
LGVTVHGKSFPERIVSEDLVPSYHETVAGRFNIGVLHTSLTGRVGHDPYAPTDVATLSAKGYDYFALGHVHAREVVREANPRIVFPGNLQGRDVSETGSKGCELVIVDGNTITSAEHVSLDVVRWHDLTLDATGLDTVTSLAQKFQDGCKSCVAGAQDRLHAMRVTIQGESALHAIEARDPGSLAAAIQAATQDFVIADLWIESVHLKLRSPIDREAAAQRPDAVGEVIKLVDELVANDGELRTWILENLDKLPNLPPDLSDVDPGKLTVEQLRAFLADAEATVLSKLSAAGA